MTRNAFTLLEVLLVIGLLVMLATMAVPLFSGTIMRRQLVESAEQLRSMMFLTGAEARQAGRRIQLAFPQPLEAPNYLADYADSENPTGPAYAAVVAQVERDPLGEPGTFDPVKADWARWQAAGGHVQIARIAIGEPIPTAAQLEGDTSSKEQAPLIVFGPDGRSLVGDVTVTLVSEALDGYVVKLRGATGLATIAPMEAVKKE